MKVFMAFLGMLAVGALIASPFVMVGYGFYRAATGSLTAGLLWAAAGLLILRLARPISTLTGKDFKIF